MRSTQAFDKALLFLAKKVDECSGAGELRLPTIHELSAMAGVSTGPMLRAVRHFRDRGIVTASQRRGIRLASGDRRPAVTTDAITSPVVRPPRPPAGPRWKMVADRVEADLDRGLYPAFERLPTEKELAARYGVSRPTIRSALAALAARGSVQAQRRGYCPTPGPRVRSRGTIVLITRGNDATGDIQFSTTRTAEQLHALEQECSKAGVNLQVVTCTPFVQPFEDGRPQDRDLLYRVDRSAMLGCIVWSLTFSPRNLARILAQARGAAGPVAVLDESDIPIAPGSLERTAVFGMSFTRTPGEHVARYLLGLGHRRFAFFSAHHQESWSRNRLLGLQDALRAAGLHGDVPAFTAAMPQHQPLAISAADLRGAVARVLPPDLAAGLDRFGPQPSADPVTGAVWTYALAERTRNSLLPLFARAAEQRAATAWVCSNDAAAIECLAYLREKGVRVPQDVSVIGFDDSPAASAHRLTSYNFNCPAIMRAMVAYVLDSRVQWRYRARGRPVEIEGFVTVRSSTGATVDGSRQS